ncbi:dihydrolipoyl dehydrogenase [Agarilytica rhodophyticola]|uniref:dihydrolipoyl dehydrogenase n=1 Tax=Agarilytica rhodophyticola TaxID=1737490 RepID=UPI001FE613DD|nr:dihydrolipoyl dehydrogenase [Agarilytica rhodophyticola]
MPKNSNKYDANLVVIGAGSGGLVSAYIAAAVKAKVFLIEKAHMGGDCLNTGCVPSKALIRAAKACHQAKHANRYGVHVDNVQVDFAAVMARVHEVIKEIEPHDSVERYTSLGVNCIQGEAKILSPNKVVVGDRELTTRHIIVATGAGPAVPPIPGLDTIDYLTSDNLWQLKELPKRLLVVGGGPIGCELAQAFSRLGANVTVVDMADKLLPRADNDVSSYVQNAFVEENIQLKLGAGLKRFSEGQAIVEKDGQEETIEFDKVLIAVGRKPNTQGFGLQELGVELNPNGTVKVDEYMRTSVEGILACGDVAGPYQFTHTASHQAWYASVNALFGGFKKFKTDYSTIPWVIFTDPEVAHVGAAENDLISAGVDYDVVKYDLDELDRAIADGENKGMVKVLMQKGKDRILGATIVGSHSGEIITEFVAAMKNKKGLNSILGTIHSYPTWSEANKYAAGNWKRANAPQTLLNWVEKYHAFRRR